MQHGLIRIAESKIIVTCPPHVAIRLRRVFGGVQRFKAGVFQLSATPSAAYDLEWFRDRHPLDIEPESAAAFAELVAAEGRKLASLAEVDAPGYVPRAFELAQPPREYQRIAADLALRTRSLLIADDVGVGKTVSSICTLTAPGALPALVVTMTHLPRQWARELARFAPALRVHRIRSGQPYDFAKVKFEESPDGKRRRVTAPGVPDVLICNYHKLFGWVEHLAGVIRTIIFDECQELRHEGTNKYNAAAALAQAADLRVGLSATPIYNYGAEIYAVINALAPQALGTHKEFFDEWCGGGGEAGVDDRRKISVKDPAALGTYLRESGIMIRRTRKDVGRELPALTVIRHVVEVDPSRINEAVADVAELAARVLERTGTNFELMKWSGEIDYRMRQATGIGKAPAVADFVRLLVEAGERVVLYGWHHEVYAIWRSAFERAGLAIAMYTGQQTESEKAESVQRFIDRRAQILVISLRAGAGLDGLQHASRTVVIGELDWSPGVHNQGIGRVHRDGQGEPVAAYYLVADEGSDPVIADVLGIKEAQAAGIRDPESASEPILVGASTDHIRKLAEDVVRRRGEKRGAA